MTNISSLGKVAFIDRLTKNNTHTGDDAAIINREMNIELITTSSMFEGVDFDLHYVPLKHLGYKAVIKSISNIYAMNGAVEYITIALGISSRFTVEQIEELYKGINSATQEYCIEIIAGDTNSSRTGLAIVITAVGTVQKNMVTRRTTAKPTELLCLSGSLGAAYIGLQILEREKQALIGNEGVQPQLKEYEYVLAKTLRPKAPTKVIEALKQAGIVPSSMIDISKGLSSAVLNICHSSNVGARVMIDRIPLYREVTKVAEELNIDPLVASLNGGDDFELLFTVPASMHKEVLPFADVIGFITEPSEGAFLVSPDGTNITLASPDFTQIKQEE